MYTQENIESPGEFDAESISRRGLLGASAFAVPAIVAVAASPAYAAVSGVAVSLSVTPSRIVPNGSATAKGTVTENGTAQAGVLVTLTASSSNVRFSTTTPTTDSSGNYTVTVTISGSSSGSASITASSSGATATAMLSWEPSPVTNVRTETVAGPVTVPEVPPVDSYTLVSTVAPDTQEVVTFTQSGGQNTRTARAGALAANSSNGYSFWIDGSKINTIVGGSIKSAGVGAGARAIEMVVKVPGRVNGWYVYTPSETAKRVSLSDFDVQLGAWDANRSIAVPAGAVDAVASTDGTKAYIASGASSGIVTVLSSNFATRSLTVAGQLTAGDTPVQCALSSDDATLYVANGVSRTLSIIDLASGSQTSTEVISDHDLSSVVARRDGAFVYVADTAGQIFRIDPTTHAVSPFYATGVTTSRRCLAVSRNNAYLYVATANSLVTLGL